MALLQHLKHDHDPDRDGEREQAEQQQERRCEWVPTGLVVRVWQGDRTGRERAAPDVHEQRRLPLVEADPHEAVVQVVRIGAPRPSAVLEPVQHDERGVEERHEQHEQWHRERDRGRCLEHALHRDRREQVADQERSGIAHEDACGMEVVAEEAE